jgi:hypothetical protein
MGVAVCAGDMKMFSVSYVNGFIDKHLLCGVSCDACKAYLPSNVIL